jgi:2'-5' RNA ligase
VRCFVALPLPEEAREALARAASEYRRELSPSFAAPSEAHRGPRISWTRRESFHITLAFLGELGAPSVAAAAEAIEAAAGFGAIRFRFAGLGSLGRGGHPGLGAQRSWRVLFAALEDGGRTALLHRLINEALARRAEAAGLGPLNPEWPKGRPFLAHVTLARAKDGAATGEAAGPGTELAGEWTLGRCSLYKSELRRAGSVYTELRGVDLA